MDESGRGIMSFDAIKFLHDYHIDHDATGDRSRPGWVQVNCPFCGGGSREEEGI